MLFPLLAVILNSLCVPSGGQSLGTKGFSRRRVRWRGVSGDMTTRPPAHLSPFLPQYLNFRRKVGLLKRDLPLKSLWTGRLNGGKREYCLTSNEPQKSEPTCDWIRNLSYIHCLPPF
jgi:hypothetical protein